MTGYALIASASHVVEVSNLSTMKGDGWVMGAQSKGRALMATPIRTVSGAHGDPEDLRHPASLDVAERTIAVNLLGPIRLVNAFLPGLLAQPTATVMTVSSGLA